MERKIAVRGQPLTLVGEELKVGQVAPDFVAVSQDMKEMGFSHVSGQDQDNYQFPFH